MQHVPSQCCVTVKTQGSEETVRINGVHDTEPGPVHEAVTAGASDSLERGHAGCGHGRTGAARWRIEARGSVIVVRCWILDDESRLTALQQFWRERRPRDRRAGSCSRE